MRLCGVAHGRLLGNRVLSHGGDVPNSSGALPVFRHTQHDGDLHLLHERHHTGIHRRSDPRRCHRTLQSAHEDRPRGRQDGRLQSREAARWPLRGNDLHVHVGVEYRGHCHDGAYHLRCSVRVGTSIN